MTRNADKAFFVVAYDITCDRRRNHLVKLLKQYGRRANYSVFECFLDDHESKLLFEGIDAIINAREDSVLYYSLCRRCTANCRQAGRSKKDKQSGHPVII